MAMKSSYDSWCIDLINIITLSNFQHAKTKYTIHIIITHEVHSTNQTDQGWLGAGLITSSSSQSSGSKDSKRFFPKIGMQ